MIIHGQFYDGIVGKPDLDDALEHYGVLGMKWGVRKDPEKAFSKAAKKSDKYARKIYKKNKQYQKEAKKISRFLGRKHAIRKAMVLNAKADVLTEKKKKWDRKTEEAFRKESDRIQKDPKLTDKEKKTKISDLEKGFKVGKLPTTTKIKKWDDSLKIENKTKLKKEIKNLVKDIYLKDDFDGYIDRKNPGKAADQNFVDEIYDIKNFVNSSKTHGHNVSYKDVEKAFNEAYDEYYKTKNR